MENFSRNANVSDPQKKSTPDMCSFSILSILQLSSLWESCDDRKRLIALD